VWGKPRGGSSPLIRIADYRLLSAQTVPIRTVIDVESGSELVVGASQRLKPARGGKTR
jgi:hypothetical protein